MKKNLFIFLVVLMVISIFGILLVQGYWILTAWENKEEEFSLAVQQSIQNVAIEVQERELSDYIGAYTRLLDSIGEPDESNFTDIFLFLDEDETSNLSTFYAYGILEEDYNIASENLNPELGAVSNIKDYKGVKTTTILDKNIFNRERSFSNSIQKIKRVDRISLFDQAKYRDAFFDFSNSLPIHKRLNVEELKFLLQREFEDKNINTPYAFGIQSEGLATRVRSKDFDVTKATTQYATPIFLDESGQGLYQLTVTFPKKNEFVFASILGIGGLTFVLTLFIVLVCSTALYQIIQQKKISEIKTDFINNMSHEFKTPIATISLAVDAINNTKTLKEPERVKQYLKMIREENTRMLTQVENVLRISQLEKSRNPIVMELIHLHPLIEEAIQHFSLILESRGGTIHTQLDAHNDLFHGNEIHFTNVLINVLDNAVKYSDQTPKIKITTATKDAMLSVTISDSGIGMDKKTQKLIFQKFYREHSGDIHNVKGHGLGLAYVKRIVDLHHGSIKIDSKKGMGTSFTIILNSRKKNDLNT